MILSAENLSYSYGARTLFENVTFNVEEGDKYGIIGVNGTGKSTLLRMLANHDAGEKGKLTIPGNVFLGGENFDNAIVKWVIDEFKKQYGADLSKDPMAYARGYERCLVTDE